MFLHLLDYHLFDQRSIVVAVKITAIISLFFVRFYFWFFYIGCAILSCKFLTVNLVTGHVRQDMRTETYTFYMQQSFISGRR